MIISNKELVDKQTLSADICIIGGGPAAISMALSYMPTSLKVILVTGGGWSQTAANKDLYRGIISPKGSHEPLEKMRRRQFGGGSAVWAGRCVPYDPIDFKYRSWVAESGWPVSYEEMLPYYEEASELCQIGSFNFNALQVFPEKQTEIIPGFDSPHFVSHLLERYSPPVHFAKTYKTMLEYSSNIHVLLDAHALSLQQFDDKGKVSDVTIAAGNKRLSISAAHFVLAAGGIETPRLLLASSNGYFPAGIGNEYDNVGRYYMTHITGTYAQISPHNRENIMFDFEKDGQEVFCRRRWRMPEQTQKEHSILNTIFYLSHAKSINSDKNFLLSAAYAAAKHFLSITGIRKSLRQAVQKSYYPPSLGALYRLGMPAILPSRKSKYWGLFFSAEQAPNRESRIRLSDTQKDAFGMPRVEMHIAFKDIDLESIVTVHNLFAKRFAEKRLGDIIYSEEGLRNYLKEKLQSYNSYAHQMGTTRMSENPETGVVDKNARVWGLDNLFIAGASTFPSGGHANPTITVIAQSLMLANHLKIILKPNHQKKEVHV